MNDQFNTPERNLADPRSTPPPNTDRNADPSSAEVRREPSTDPHAETDGETETTAETDLAPSVSTPREILDSLAKFKLDKYVLRLYVADSNVKSQRAIKTIRDICEQYLPERYELEIIDIYQNPEQMEKDQIFAIPTLIKEMPPPLQKLIGDMTDTDKLIICLDL